MSRNPYLSFCARHLSVNLPTFISYRCNLLPPSGTDGGIHLLLCTPPLFSNYLLSSLFSALSSPPWPQIILKFISDEAKVKCHVSILYVRNSYDLAHVLPRTPHGHVRGIGTLLYYGYQKNFYGARDYLSFALK